MAGQVLEPSMVIPECTALAASLAETRDILGRKLIDLGGPIAWVHMLTHV